METDDSSAAQGRLRDEVRAAVQRAGHWLVSAQGPEGFWWGELEADVSVGAGYLPLVYLVTGSIPQEKSQQIVKHIRSKQREDGSWSAYAEGPGDLNVCVQTYFALKLAGVSPQEEWMRRARQYILGRGGLCGINTIVRFWLALFGQIEWSLVPVIPPELILFPTWFPFNIYEFASWSRATIVALMVLSALRPVYSVPVSAELSDLVLEGHPVAPYRFPRGRQYRWERFFLRADRLLQRRERAGWKPGRKRALEKAESWILEHQEEDGSWGGILLPWVYSLIALHSLGYPPDHPVLSRGMEGLESFFVQHQGSDALWLQPATSPVWDTAWATLALSESGLSAEEPHLQRAARWLLGRQVLHPGDWKIRNPRTRPGCWAFEFVNRFYPDLDDTAVVPRALLRVRLSEEEEPEREAAISRAVEWVVGMQSKDGGWAAFDRDNDRKALSHVPFADFMTPLDPTSADVTAHVLELLAETRPEDPSLCRGVDYLRRIQEPDGAWYGRWGVNYLYGTGLSLAALQATGHPDGRALLGSGAAWLISRQNADGGWGESCHSYEDPSTRGLGRSTASQTAWALLGLLAALEAGVEGGRETVAAVQRGVRYLLSTQSPSGEWPEDLTTGTGFPRAFYLRYDLYRVYFPLLALSRFLKQPQELRAEEQRLARIPPSQRVLLVSHCLRRAASCSASYGPWGLECHHCKNRCAIHSLSEAASRLGYMGTCIAPGGRLALKYVEVMKPRGVVAVACSRELEEGVRAIQGNAAWDEENPVVVVIPLARDGCVDTEVDVERVIEALSAGLPVVEAKQ